MMIQFSANALKTLQEALVHYGVNVQTDATIEECAELIVALNKHVKRAPKVGLETLNNVIDEMADVEIMLAQMRIAFEIDDSTIQRQIELKLNKLKGYLCETYKHMP